MEKLAIGIDLGCTHIKALLVKEDGTVLKEVREHTNEHDEHHWKNEVARIIKAFKKESGDSIKAIGLSAPGLANVNNTCIECMPGRLIGIENFNWSDFTGEEIFVLNDGHAALMAEVRFGIAKNLNYVAMLTLGTGVGGGILIDGKLYQGVGQMAGHFGHTTVDALDSDKDTTNMPGSLEDAIGNLSIPKRSNGKFETTFDLVKAHEQGDAFATEVWLTSIKKLAASIASFVNILSPELIILGGGVSKAGDLLLKPLDEYRAQFEWRPKGKYIPVKLAQFSDLAGALGAAGFALSKTSS